MGARLKPAEAAALPASPSASAVGQVVVGAVRWTALARGAIEIATFVSTLVLARLLTPAEFGQASVGLFVFALGVGIGSQGIGAYLVQSASTTREDMAVATTLSLLAGVAATALAALAAVTIAPAIFGTEIARLLLLSTPSLLFFTLASVPQAQLQRDLDFKRLGLVEAGAAITGPAVAIALAAFGVGAEALVASWLTTALITWLLGLALAGPVRPALSLRGSRAVAHFGLPAFGSSLVYIALRNVDYALLAAKLPASSVGLYYRAFQLGSDYQAKISGILLRVAFPVLSRSPSLAEVTRLRTRIVGFHTAALFPLLLLLVATAPALVPLAFGSAWDLAAPLTQILAVGGMVAAVSTGTGPLLMALGRPRLLLAYNLVALAVYAAAVIVAVPHGIEAVCWAVVAAQLVTFVVLQWLLVERRAGVMILASTFRDVVLACWCSVPLLIIAFASVRWLGGPSRLAAVALACSAGLAAYALMLRRFNPRMWADALRLARRRST